MRVGQPFRFPEARWQARKRVGRVAWLSILLLGIGATGLYLTTGSSEAMKTAWITDLLTALPPAAWLVASRFELRQSTRRFPFGYFRAISVSFLVTAGTLMVFGLSLFYDAAMKLVRQERPPIGTMELFGHQFWAGWAMIAALTLSLSFGMLLGRLKKPLAEKVHDKEVESEAQMNKAEWMSEGAAILGVLLVGFGFWWADAAAAAFISIEVVHDGWINLRQAVGDLMDESPSKMGESDLEDIPTRLRRAAEELSWVEKAAVRLREQGHVLSGEIFVVPRDGHAMTARELMSHTEQAAEELRKIDWRLYGLTISPVAHLEEQNPPRL